NDNRVEVGQTLDPVALVLEEDALLPRGEGVDLEWTGSNGLLGVEIDREDGVRGSGNHLREGGVRRHRREPEGPRIHDLGVLKIELRHPTSSRETIRHEPPERKE